MSCWKLSFNICFIHSILFFIFIGFTEGLQDQQLCNSSSCGDLVIQYPFRLKADPVNCGHPNYELTCSDNRTFLQFRSNEFFVKQIDYAYELIQVIEVGLLRSNCSLPLKSMAPTFYRSLGYYNLIYEWSWFSLLNCSKKLTSLNYQLIPCLSQKDSYVYGVYSHLVEDLAPSCSLLSLVPVVYNSSSYSDLFQAIKEGIYLSWSTDALTTSTLIRECIRESKSMFHDNLKENTFISVILAIFRAEWHLPACIDDYSSTNNHFKLVSYLAIVVIVIIEIVQLVIVLILIGRLVFAPLTVCVFLAHKFLTIWPLEDVVEKFLKTQQNFSPIRYTYAHIITITRQFKEQLGRGGFGSVYKGELPGGHFVAVKLLAENSKCSGDDFISEVSTLGRIHHLNIVRLVGFCSEGSKRALIYEFMPNKSLDKYIFSSERYFTWQKLNNIALGVARGINYLHCGCDMTILHFDIKPQNILLDQNFLPKISDFGLAKLYPKEYNAVYVSAGRGTIGYMAPELVSRNFGVISHKSDVYSFGMLLMEMASGRRNIDRNATSSNENYYPSLIYDKLNNYAKEGIKIESFEINEMEKKLYLVALWCIQMRSSDRPSMRHVVRMIEGDVDALELPPKPFISCSSTIPTTLHSVGTATMELAVIEEDNSKSDNDHNSTYRPSSSQMKY